MIVFQAEHNILTKPKISFKGENTKDAQDVVYIKKKPSKSSKKPAGGGRKRVAFNDG
jgi:hypothetical protein